MLKPLQSRSSIKWKRLRIDVDVSGCGGLMSAFDKSILIILVIARFSHVRHFSNRKGSLCQGTSKGVVVHQMNGAVCRLCFSFSIPILFFIRASRRVLTNSRLGNIMPTGDPAKDILKIKARIDILSRQLWEQVDFTNCGAIGRLLANTLPGESAEVVRETVRRTIREWAKGIYETEMVGFLILNRSDAAGCCAMMHHRFINLARADAELANVKWEMVIGNKHVAVRGLASDNTLFLVDVGVNPCVKMFRGDMVGGEFYFPIMGSPFTQFGENFELVHLWKVEQSKEKGWKIGYRVRPY